MNNLNHLDELTSFPLGFQSPLRDVSFPDIDRYLPLLRDLSGPAGPQNQPSTTELTQIDLLQPREWIPRSPSDSKSVSVRGDWSVLSEDVDGSLLPLSHTDPEQEQVHFAFEAPLSPSPSDASLSIILSPNRPCNPLGGVTALTLASPSLGPVIPLPSDLPEASSSSQKASRGTKRFSSELDASLIEINDGMVVDKLSLDRVPEFLDHWQPLLIVSKDIWQQEFPNDPRIHDRKKSKARMGLVITVYDVEFNLAIGFNNGLKPEQMCKSAMVHLPSFGPLCPPVSLLVKSIGCDRSLWVADAELSNDYSMPTALTLVQKNNVKYGVYVIGAPHKVCSHRLEVFETSRRWGKRQKE